MKIEQYQKLLQNNSKESYSLTLNDMDYAICSAVFGAIYHEKKSKIFKIQHYNSLPVLKSLSEKFNPDKAGKMEIYKLNFSLAELMIMCMVCLHADVIKISQLDKNGVKGFFGFSKVLKDYFTLIFQKKKKVILDLTEYLFSTDDNSIEKELKDFRMNIDPFAGGMLGQYVLAKLKGDPSFEITLSPKVHNLIGKLAMDLLEKSMDNLPQVDESVLDNDICKKFGDNVMRLLQG